MIIEIAEKLALSLGEEKSNKLNEQRLEGRALCARTKLSQMELTNVKVGEWIP